MPNWCQTNVVMTGPKEDLDRLAEQVSKPYVSEHYDVFKEEFVESTTEGVFLLWNIVKPDDMDSYLQKAKIQLEKEQKADRLAKQQAEPESITIEGGKVLIEDLQEKLNNFDMSDVMDKYQFGLEFGEDWWNWNIRNWGTKWEIGDSGSVHRADDNKLIYDWATAWSPCVQALDKLAEQYPTITMVLKCHDEGDMFAAEIHWEGGEQTFDCDLESNHGTLEDIYGECWACADGDGADPDTMEHYRCAEFKIDPMEVETVL